MDNNIKVAVRVRPFNKREKERNAKCIISMNGKVTTIQNPETGEKKPFSFDFSYWSHCSEDMDYADQSKVFKDLGVTVLENAWNGYNASLFAYGQTGQHKHKHEFLVPLNKFSTRIRQELQHGWVRRRPWDYSMRMRGDVLPNSREYQPGD